LVRPMRGLIESLHMILLHIESAMSSAYAEAQFLSTRARRRLAFRSPNCHTNTMFRGHSPNVKFPRILGIEAVGLVEESPGGQFTKGDIVATAMGEMGREFDGGEYSDIHPRHRLMLSLF